MFLFLLFLSLSIYIKLRYLRIALLPKQEIELTSPQKNQKQDESLCLSFDNKPRKFFSHTIARSEELLGLAPRGDSKFVVLPPVRIVQNPPKKNK